MPPDVESSGASFAAAYPGSAGRANRARRGPLVLILLTTVLCGFFLHVVVRPFTDARAHARALRTASFVTADALAARDALGVFETVLSGVLHDIDGGVVLDEALLGFPLAKRESSRGAFTLVTNVASH
jgi:hypothetical protein